jgi:hypothetical protein
MLRNATFESFHFIRRALESSIPQMSEGMKTSEVIHAVCCADRMETYKEIQGSYDLTLRFEGSCCLRNQVQAVRDILDCVTFNMGAINTAETSEIIYQSAWHNIPELQGDQKSLCSWWLQCIQKYFKHFQSLTMITELKLRIGTTVLYWTRSSRTQFGVSINVWRLAGDTLNITCNFLYCNHQVYRDFLIILYKSSTPMQDVSQRIRPNYVNMLPFYATRRLGYILASFHGDPCCDFPKGP